MAADNRFITNLREGFKRGDIVTQLIYINVGVFIAVSLVNLFLVLFKAGGGHWMNYLMFPASVTRFITQPWTLLTYMFMHAGILHILFNMLWLYWFGRLFLGFFSARHLRGLYVLGGIAGAALSNRYTYSRGCGVFFVPAGRVGFGAGDCGGYRRPRADYPVQFMFIGTVRSST